MSLNPFFDGLENTTNAGSFFVALTERLGSDGSHVAGDDLVQLARVLGIPVPPELAGASIVSSEGSKLSEEAKCSCSDRASPRVVITYPPVVTPGSGQTEKTFSKCFKVCQTVAGAKVCAEVCVDIHIGFSGIGGNITATVSVAF